MVLQSRLKTITAMIGLMTLAACGGGGGGSSTPTNSAPVARAGADQSVDEFAAVTLDGSTSSDADSGDTLTYAWTQTAGTTVTIANASTAQPGFDAPDVLAIDTPATLTFELAVSDGRLSRTDSVTVTVNNVGLGANSPPTANAGGDQGVGGLTTVTLDGTGSSDADGDAFTYAWLQMAGPDVMLSDLSIAQPSFTSPDVTAGNPLTLTFQLTVDDGTDNTTDTVDIIVQEALSQVTVAGKVSFEFVLPNNNCGLDFNNIVTRPIRAATVQLIDAANNVLEQVVSGDDGAYSFADIAANTDVRIRVRAELKRTGSPSWNVEVRDNVDISPTAPPLSQRPLYVVQWALFSTGVNHITDADFVATTGWGTNSYTGTRAAAPFAILDTIYNGMRLVLTADASANFSPLDAFWSVNNTLSAVENIDAGELPTSFYQSFNDSLFLLGDAAVDTEEFDDHVIMHEWGHYFEDNFSRSDSIGGPHSIGETIDARLAFGEGWATALAAMALDNPQYCDSRSAGSTVGFSIDTENENRGQQGFYNEMSVATLLYDLWDTNPDGSDNSSISFGPIFDTMTQPQATTAAFTTVFSFATELRAMLGAEDLAFLDSQLARENIDTANLDIYGDGQTIVPTSSMDVLPIHSVIVADGSILNICSNSDNDLDGGGNLIGDGNKLSEYRYLRTTITQQRRYRIVATTVSTGLSGDSPSQPPAGFDCIAAFENDPDDPAVHTYSDPDFGLFLNGEHIWGGYSCTPNREETLTNTLIPGDYVIDLRDFRFGDPDTISGYPGRVCIDVSITPN